MIDLLDLHTHSLASGHAYNSLYEMACSASQKGLSLYGCSEHAPAMPGSCHTFYFTNYRVVPRTLYNIPILLGTELNIIDFQGNVDLDERILNKVDYAIASLHTPCIDTSGTMADYTRAYLACIKNPLIHIIGHPDDSRYPIDYLALVQAAKEYGVLLELNNNSLHPLGARENPIPNDVVMLRYCMEYQVPIILGSDAHTLEDVGNHCFVDPLLETLQFPEELIVNRSVKEYKKYINRYREQ